MHFVSCSKYRSFCSPHRKVNYFIDEYTLDLIRIVSFCYFDVVFFNSVFVYVVYNKNMADNNTHLYKNYSYNRDFSMQAMNYYLIDLLIYLP